jgi:hypothetical protein
MKNFKISIRSSFLIGTLFLYLFFSCSDTEKSIKPVEQQPSLTTEEINRLILLDSSFTYPEDKALNDAKLIAKQFDKEDNLNPAPRKIKNTIILNTQDKNISQKKQFRRSDEDVPEIYIFNFEEQRGFALLSADERVLGTFGASSEGNVDSVLVNTGLKIFLTNAISYIERKRFETEKLRDSIFDSLLIKLKLNDKVNIENLSSGRSSDVIHSCSGTNTTVLSTTILSTTYVSDFLIKTQWDQNPPYNNNFTSSTCVTSSPYCGITNTNFLAGCVPISEAQIVAHFYAKNDPSWNRIINAPYGEACSLSASDIGLVAKLTRDIFGEYGSSALGCLGTGAGTPFSSGNHGISPKYGLHNGEFRNYNVTDVTNSLQNGSPLIIQGYQHECCLIFCWGCGDGHQWILDGMRHEYTKTTLRVSGYNAFTCAYVNYTYDRFATNTKVHYNWGWGRAYNGWFLEGVFGNPNPNEFNHADQIIAYITPF